MSILTKDNKKNGKLANKKKKKIRHQSLNTPFLLFQPNSKYFNNPQNDSSDESLRPKNHSMKKVIKVDNKFIIFDLLNKINRSYDEFLYTPLTSKNIIISDKEKDVRLKRILGILNLRLCND
jgi:hypothetical protein